MIPVSKLALKTWCSYCLAEYFDAGAGLRNGTCLSVTVASWKMTSSSQDSGVTIEKDGDHPYIAPNSITTVLPTKLCTPISSVNATSRVHTYHGVENIIVYGGVQDEPRQGAMSWRSSC
jgi:hypothetical protein